jgi:prevent-host-death family protein
MKTLMADEFKKNFVKVIESVEDGEEITITFKGI